MIFYIGGSPCAGKSTAAEHMENLTRCKVLHLDDFTGETTKAAAKDSKPCCSEYYALLNSENGTDKVWMRDPAEQCEKEIGIYRAIGVSKKNLVFKFIVEALVLTTLTVFIGYLATSAFMAACLALSPMVETVFFYPLWLALAVLVILYALCLFCGTLPITLLLRKTPSEILAKYDI